jgi:3-isopropylmalate/(R)-2-methylmalate dehydratase small subunit
VLGEGFPAKLREFEIFVAGRNFGCGSAREQAATAIMGLGVKAVVASSFSRTFYRNAINSGLTIVECPEIYNVVQEGDALQIDLAAGVIRHRDHDYLFPKFPDSVRELLDLGGLAEYLKARKA